MKAQHRSPPPAQNMAAGRRSASIISLCVGLSVLVSALGAGVARAQQRPRSPAQPMPELSAADLKSIEERVADWLKTCLGDWDAATHMSKAEWRATCQRVANDRGRFLREDALTNAGLETKRRRP